MTRSTPALLVALLPLAVSAQTIYKCVDANGGTTYASSRLGSHCKVISSGPENAYPAPKAKSHSAASNPSPAGFPRVQEDTQKARDGDRRLILEQELAGEQRSLEQARKELADQVAAQGGQSERATSYRESIGRHERNIQAIQKELGNLK